MERYRLSDLERDGEIETKTYREGCRDIPVDEVRDGEI